ncbi:MAG: hypothetical protein EXQ56_05910 [Acidobacteria bacterium]|nr:hypothetical protein [Acidobacteriota bacterium]
MNRMIARVFAGVLLVYSLAWAQAGPKVSGVEPATGKVGSSVTISGENLGKDIVEAVYLSDDEKDYPAQFLEQSASKVVVKIPELKAGGYNIALKVGNNIFIQPIRITVE